MSHPDVILKHKRFVGDTQVPFGTRILDDEGVTMNLTGKTAKFSMYSVEGVQLIPPTAATIVSPTQGHVSYDFSAADVAVGNASTDELPHSGFFHIFDGSLEVYTFPADGIDIVIIDPTKDLNPDPSIDFAGLANAPKRTRTEEGTVEERTIDELIKADQYLKQQVADGAPWGIRVARAKPGSTTPGPSRE